MQAQAPVEQKVWEGSPSQWLNFKAFLLCGLGSLLALVAAAFAWAGLSSELRDQARTYFEECRDRKRTRVLDMQ